MIVTLLYFTLLIQYIQPYQIYSLYQILVFLFLFFGNL
jgi:hypothetical protein